MHSEGFGLQPPAARRVGADSGYCAVAKPCDRVRERRPDVEVELVDKDFDPFAAA